MKPLIRKLTHNQDGAVTVDWVVLTAAIVGLGLAVITTVSRGALDHSTSLGSYLDNQSIDTY